MKFSSLIFLILFWNISFCQSSSPKPNILILLADDQGWGDLGFTGNKTASTPHIDQLARQGIFFNHFYVSPVCSPTRAEMLTGRYHVRAGVSGVTSGKERMDLDETTMAQYFKSAGYMTGLFGKWHNGAQGPYHPSSRGFDEFYGFTFGHIGNYFQPALQHNGQPIRGNGFITDDFTNQGIEFIDQHKDHPFLAYFAFNTPHSPMQVPDAYWDKYKNRNPSQKGTLAEKENIEHTKAAMAMNENLDWNVGRIMNELERLHLLDNTIVIYFSDNGPNGNRWNNEMKGIKGSTDEGGIRSPFIIQWKNHITPGKRIQQIAGAIDILPTLIDLTGISKESKKLFDGISLKPVLFGGNEKIIQNRILPTYWTGKTSVRSQRFRLSDDDQLYDLKTDSSQTKDVSKIYKDDFEKLSSFKKNWKQNVLSELPPNDQRPFLIGYPALQYEILPASEASSTGSFIRSSIHPNDSYYKQWRNDSDRVIWNVQVMEEGDFEVEFHYACSDKNIGTSIELSFGDAKVISAIQSSNDAEIIGKREDRVERDESYLKIFKPLSLGRIRLNKGDGSLVLHAVGLKYPDDLEFYRLVFKRVK